MAANPELLEYVRTQLKAGYPENQIRQMLVQSGWLPEEIDEAFMEAKQKTVSLAVKEPEPKKEEPVKEKKSFFGFMKKEKKPEEKETAGKFQESYMELPEVQKEKEEKPRRPEEKPKKEEKPEEKKLMQKPLFEGESRKGAGFLLTMIAGIFILINGVYTGFMKEMTGDILTAWGMTIELIPMNGMDMIFGVLSIIIGALIIIFYMILRRMGKTTVAGILILVLSIVALAVGGFFVGAGVGIIAGISVLLKK